MAGSAWTNQVQFLVIVAGPAGAGVFVYDPSAGPGNLIASMTDATKDPFGNATVKGTASYVTFGGDKFAVALNQVGPGGIPGFTVQDLSSVPNVPAGVYAEAAASGLADAQLHSGKATAGDVFASVAVVSAIESGTSAGKAIITAGLTTVSGQVIATGGTPAAPTQITTGTWQNMILLNGWTVSGGGYAEYKLEPNNRVSVRATNLSTGTITNNTSIWTPPAAYNPTVTQRVELYVEASTGAAGVDTPRFDTGTGFFSCFNVPTGTTLAGFNGSYALD